MTADRHAFRASFLHCLDDPDTDPDALEFLADGWLLIEDGHVVSLSAAVGDRAPTDAPFTDLRGKLVVPGLVDTHVHFPQVDVIASHGSQLLDWLERYTFPAEARFADPGVAADAARFFLDQLLANGTTTALVFGTSHRTSVEAFFHEAEARGLRMIAGQVLMDRNAPDELIRQAPTALDDTRELIQAWHGKGRLGYAVTPRFAPTSTDAQLAAAGRLIEEHRDLHGGVHLHTHLAENHDELQWVAELFPDDRDYLAVYERHGLVGKRSVFAHALHLENDGWQRLGNSGAAVSHCPTSNLFIGSGLFDLAAACRHGVPVGLGTDIGGGDSFSLLRTINEAYKVQQLQNQVLTPDKAFYLATLGGARALDLDAYIGSFQPGREADLVVLDPQATPVLARRTACAEHWRDMLFALMMLGDDRAIAAVYLMGARYRGAALI